MPGKPIEEVTLNKGEWAEFYVMLKLLGEGKLYTANALLQRNIDNYLNIVKVIREESDTGVIDYIVDDERDVVQIRKRDTGELLEEVHKTLFDETANTLFININRQRGSSLPAPASVCAFARIIYVNQPKAPAVKALERQFGGKNDIFIEVRDPSTSIKSIMGFSIKSKFGQAPTLFNAGTTSQMLYEVMSCNDGIMETFNNFVADNKREWGRCKEYVQNNGINLDFVSAMYQTYQDNLSLVTESMPRILGWCFKDTMMGIDVDNRILETCDRLAIANPLDKSNPDVFYKKILKDYLMAGFTGMTAGQVWDGEEQVNGGYIVVMDDGEVLCYHSNDREAFRNYLFKNTHFEYVSAKKYKWSFIFKEDNHYYLPINASVRFCKETR